ncbi:helix-turn-helix transcriptional regulator [Catenulispora rubra]|uniref:helix-turn-helix transcriptional regulator n=1 Tax=Catenulispora rubra TaxID=280293 RepID=UPI00189235C4|nr:WYL domain-containing protein [Catenulispora rubra]
MPKTSARLLSLLSLLQARRDWPGADLASRLEVSARTVRRDVDRLRELGYPIATVKGPDGGYRLGAGSELPPLLFDDDQAVALAAALQSAVVGGGGMEEAAMRALNTVRQVMPSRLRRRVDMFQVTAIGTAAAAVGVEVLMTLSAAVHAREVLRFDYADAPRKAEPHHLVTRGGRWYLVAWDLDRDDWRVFRADHISPRTPNGPRFTPREVPGGDVAAFVTSRFQGNDGTGGAGGTDGTGGVGGWPCRGEVILHAPIAAVAPFAPFAHDAVVEELDSERCRLVLGSWSWPALAAAIGVFDADVEVVGPPELKAAFALLARRYAAA